MLTETRAEILTNYLSADADRAKTLFDLDPKDALEKINADGVDFTIEELEEYCTSFKSYVSQQAADGELSADALDDVAGGVVITTAICVKVGLGLVGCFGAGAAVGIAAGAKW